MAFLCRDTIILVDQFSLFIFIYKLWQIIKIGLKTNIYTGLFFLSVSYQKVIKTFLKKWKSSRKGKTCVWTVLITLDFYQYIFLRFQKFYLFLLSKEIDVQIRFTEIKND